MKPIILIGVAVALVTGIAIGGQSTLTSRIALLLGPFRTGLLMNVIGGSIAGVIGLIYWYTQRDQAVEVTRSAFGMLFMAGMLGLFVITGVGFAFTRIGVTAGFATLILGQMLVSVVVDSLGLGGIEPIPINASRVLGLLVLGVSVYLLVPRS